MTAAVKVVGRARGDIEGPIQPGETLTVAAVFRDAQRLKSSGMVLKLFPMGGGAPVAVNMLEVVRRQANKGRTSVIVSGGGGVLQLERGDAGSALVGAWGLGGQLLYGVSGNFSLDIGLSGLVSGESDIAGVARSERLYRLHGGVRYLIRDDGWIPYARVGAGVALVSERDGDDSSFAFRMFGQVGAGVTRWLAESLVLGAEVFGETSFGGSGTIGAGNIYLGFSWGGNEF
ncbi:hypothetical protein [Haliangium sp.]|uniref:hypothetical protein n=1 Tax=Haliangium sp. TaxID=2663208 RepID=UPI003D09B8B8